MGGATGRKGSEGPQFSASSLPVVSNFTSVIKDCFGSLDFEVSVKRTLVKIYVVEKLLLKRRKESKTKACYLSQIVLDKPKVGGTARQGHRMNQIESNQGHCNCQGKRQGQV